ncbi:MAG: glycine cleavage system protein H [Candidatus Cloacimonadota bacterium]|nr:MAG: glycine cleavage system protein H [Candidatus Cloacimonadota bacterium]
MDPKDLKFTKDHEWISPVVDGVVRVGISDHAQEELGDIVFVDFSEPTIELDKGEMALTIESVKAASDVYAPCKGVLCTINEALVDESGLVNESCYEDGWLYEFKPENASDLDSLMTYEQYQEFLSE